MNEDNNKSKKQLFDELVKNLSLSTQYGLHYDFICPLCMKGFNSLNDLSDAHIFPKALGGRKATLACQRCNSNIGSKIEAFEVERAKLTDALSGTREASLRAKIKLNSGKNKALHTGAVTVDLSFSKTGKTRAFHMRPLDKCYNPKMLEEMLRNWGKEDFSISLTFSSRMAWAKGKFTYLHSAYLFLFSQFGYNWALAPCAAVIREQLKFPEKEIIPFECIELLSPELAQHLPFNEFPITWYSIEEPEESRGFLILFSGLSYNRQPLAVWMPLFDYSYKPPKETKFLLRPLPNLGDYWRTA